MQHLGLLIIMRFLTRDGNFLGDFRHLKVVEGKKLEHGPSLALDPETGYGSTVRRKYRLEK